MKKTYQLALSIVEKLTHEGYVAYFAGGWVRDFLLDHPSDDIDIATNATPDIVQSLFPHTVAIGIAFGIVLVVIEGYSFEVATFRKETNYHDKRRPSSIAFTTAIEDAKRRDFTINGMFYDPIKKEILDYVEGQKDLKDKIIRAIGDPHERIQEDRLRMVRAIRFACRFNFTIEPVTEKAISTHATELFPYVAIERIWQEITKMAAFKNFDKALEMLFTFGLLQQIFPHLQEKSIKNLQRKLQHINNLPVETPTIAKILELFSHLSLEEKIHLCRHFKLSNEEMNFTIFYHESEKLFLQKHVEKYTWAHFYANKWSSLVIQIIASKKSLQEKTQFLQEQCEMEKSLEKDIERIQQNNPLVRAMHLQEAGIVPGKDMGNLLKLAEKIAINETITDPDEVIQKLKTSFYWPKADEQPQE